MLRENDVLDHATVARLLDGGHSRLPVCRCGRRHAELPHARIHHLLRRPPR
jgi:CBS domain containing-hemolysin-like protein